MSHRRCHRRLQSGVAVAAAADLLVVVFVFCLLVVVVYVLVAFGITAPATLLSITCLYRALSHMSISHTQAAVFSMGVRFAKLAVFQVAIFVEVIVSPVA